ANPVVAALPGEAFAIAWNDLGIDGSALGIALRRLDTSVPALGSMTRANDKTLGAQYDPDLIALDNGDLVVAWTDASAPLEGPTVVARQFDANLAPLGGEQVLGGSSLPEGNVVLTPFAGSWAASWREAQVDGSEVIVVFFAGARWTIAVAQPGPASDRPALMALDDEHLFVGYTVGTDPLGTGTAATPRLEAAVVDTFDSSVTLLGPVEPLDPDYSGTAPERSEE